MSDINQRATTTVEINGEQARQELDLLKREAEAWRKKMVEASEAGDVKGFKKAEQELRKVNSQMRAMQKSSIDIDRVLNNLSTAGPKELQRSLKAINSELNSGRIQRGTAAWDKYQKQARLVSAELRKINAEQREALSWAERFNNGLSKWGGTLASAMAAVTGVTLALSKMRKDRNDKEESADNLKALTGLDDDSIAWLTRQAEILSTTMDKSGLRVKQSSRDILEAYMLVGSAKPELLSDKEALNSVTIEAMRLSAAAKMDLKAAVDAVTISLNQYGAGADQAAKFTNILAAGSKYGAAGVVSETAALVKSGVAAAGAKVEIEQLVGTIEMLGEKGIKDEVAGTGLKTFFLRLQTGAKETNPAIVGLDKALENLKKKNMDAGQIKKMFGDEAYSVAKILIDNAEKVQYYTKAVTDTNVATEQAAINSDNAAAKSAQMKNQLKEAGIELMEKLNPSINILGTYFTNLVKILPPLIGFLQKHGAAIVYLIAVIGAYIGMQKLVVLWETKVKDANLLTIATQKLKAYWDKIVTASTWLYIAATSALTGKISQARLAMQAFFLVTKAHPLGLLLSVITAVAGGLYLFATRTKKAKTLTEDFFSAISEERNELNKIYNQLLRTNEKTSERTKLINEFNSRFGTYLTNLLDEKSTVDDIKKAYREATAAMNDHYARELLASKQSEIVKESLDAQSKALKQSVDAAVNATKDQKARLSELINDVTNQTITDNPQYGTGNVRQKIYEQINKEFYPGAAYELFGGSQGWENFSKEISPFIKAVDGTINKVAKLKEELSPFIKNLSDVTVKEKDGDHIDKPLGNDDGEDKDALKKKLKQYDDEAAAYKAHIVSMYAIGEITKTEHDAFIEQGERNLLQKKMLLYAQTTSEYSNLLIKLKEMDIKNQEACTKESLGDIENGIKARKRELTEQYADEYLTKEAYEEGLLQLDREALVRKRNLYMQESKEFNDYQKQIDDFDAQDKEKRHIAYQQKLESLRKEYSTKSVLELRDKELSDLQKLLDNKLIRQEEYEKLKAAITRKYAGVVLDRNVNMKGDNLPESKESTGLFGEENNRKNEQLQDLKTSREQDLISDKDYYQRKSEIMAEYYDGVLSKAQMVYSSISSVVSAYSDYNQACQDLEEAKINKKYDAEIKAAGKNSTQVAKLEDKKEKELAKVKSKYADRAFKIQIAQGLAQTAMSAISAYSSAATVPVIGYILAPIAAGAAIAAGMLQMATIYKQHEAAKQGYMDGGFTGSGSWNEEKGPVHANEFVANRFAVRNKQIRPVLNLIDQAQKNNTVGRLRASDVSRVLSNDRQSSGSTNFGSTEEGQPGVPVQELMFIMSRSAEVIDKLTARLNEPFQTINTVDGPTGMKQAFDKYNGIQKNKSRHD